MAERLTLVDTSVWVAVLRERPDRDLADNVTALMMAGTAAWNGMIRLELWNGVRDARERAHLRDMESLVRDLPADDPVWTRAVLLADRARGRGLTVPASDLLIFACANVHNAALLHRDRHFDLLDAL